MTTQTWTPERIDRLRNYVGAGLTCSQIAAEIGITRNAVIGKIHRLGLGPGRGGGPPVRRRATGAPSQQSPLRRALRAVRTHAELIDPAIEHLADSAHPCSLLDLAGNTCRWPISDPGKADFAFCGNEAIAGVSYCAGHARMAYRSSARRSA
jgi:GcrA cell cycle regulator